MIIGFDAKRAAFNRTGLGNYSRYVIDIMSDLLPKEQHLLYVPSVKPAPFLESLLQKEQVTRRNPDTSFGKRLSAVWRTKGIVRQMQRDGVELFHGLSNELPVGIQRSGIKSVVTIHDLIFLRYPRFYKPIDRFIYNLKFRYACKVAHKVIAVSERTKLDIIELYGTSADKIDVVYQGCDPVFTQSIEQSSLENIRQKYALPKEFILYVGSIEERKNLLLAVKALKHMKQDIPLIAVGKRTAYTDLVEKQIAEEGLQNRVKLIHNVPFFDLPAFYQLGKVFVYPSLYEGFGIPIIEAIHGGLPVVAATGSCLEEAGGPDSIYVDPHNEQELAMAFDRVLSDESFRQRMISAGKEYVKRFDPKQHALEILSVYKSCF